MLGFIDQFDPVQIRYAGAEFRRLLENIAGGARMISKVSITPLVYDLCLSTFSDTRQPILAVQPLRTAILRLDPTGSCFTSSHRLFAHIVMESRAYSAALPVLDKDIFHFPLAAETASAHSLHPYPCSQHESSSTFITYASNLTERLSYPDYVEYFLFGGMIYIALRKWERALLFLEVAIIAPTPNAVSMIQVEAYKKCVLVGLLLKGRVRYHPTHDATYFTYSIRSD